MDTQLNVEDAAFVKSFIKERYWKTSRPNRYYPVHQYTVRDYLGTVTPGKTDWSDETEQAHIDFTRFVRLLDTHGVPTQWGAKTYRYLMVDGINYWHMFLKPERTDLINRDIAK